MRKEILITTGIAVGIAISVLGVIYFMNSIDQSNRNRAEEYGFEYATKDCQSSLSDEVCSDLEKYLDPPTDWNEVDYVVYVDSKDRKTFKAIVYVQIDIYGNIKINKYDNYS